jgi:ElaB/YqjD/DUF883 family membrane-anchored ribosome-binding protein
LLKEAKMNAKSHPHYFSNWASERFDEIESTLKAIEFHAGAFQAERRQKAEKAISEIRAQGKAFQGAIRSQLKDGEAASTAATNDLAPIWASFEATVQKYLAETGEHAKEQGATFKARAEAQAKAWQQTFDALHADSTVVAIAQKHEFNKALDHLKAEADVAKSKLKKQQKAGEQSWAAFRNTLEESRSAFDKASLKAFEAFKKAD